MITIKVKTKNHAIRTVPKSYQKTGRTESKSVFFYLETKNLIKFTIKK
jgi:hypothetical protein